MTLLSRLLLLVASALLPAVGVQVYAETQARATRESLVHEEAARLARLVAAEHERLIDGTRLLLSAVGNAPPVLERDVSACRTYMAGLVTQFPHYVNIAAAGIDGRVFCSRRVETLGLSVADRAWFREALQTGDFVTSEYLVSRGSGRPSLGFAQPFRNAAGDIAGVTAVSIDVAWLAEQLGRLSMPEGAAVALMDRNGTVLARRPPLDDVVGKPAPDSILAMRMRGREGTEIAHGVDGVRRVIGYVPLGHKPEGLLVTVGLDAATAFAKVKHASRVAFFLIALGIGLALLLVFLGSRRLIAAPTKALLAAAERWRGGDLSARADGAPLRDGSSEFSRLGTAFDAMAGALQAREAALTLSEATAARLAAERSAILEQLAEGVVVTDPSGRITFVNEAAARIHGVAQLDVAPEEYARTYRLFTLDGHPHPPETLPLARAVRRGETVTDAAWRIRRSDGTEVVAVGSAGPVLGLNGAPLGAVLTLRDDTAHRAAEAARAESEARLRLAVQSAEIGVWELDLRRGCWRLDARAARITGARVEPDQWADAGSPGLQAWFTAIHPEDAPVRDAAHDRICDGADEVYAVEYRVANPQGGWAWIAKRAIAVERDPQSGRAARLVGIAQDVTARRDLQATLEAQVAERTVALRESEARLAQAAKMEALGRLAGGVAHDFNNVLQAVQGGVAMARKRLTRDPEGALRLLDLAADATARGAAVTGRLLAFSRRSDLETTTIEPVPLLEGLAQMLRHTLGPSVAVQVEVAAGTPALLADAGQLEAVLVNLANNARDALPEGNGRITLAASPYRPAPPHLARGGHVCILVSDNGQGMAPEVLERVSEPFFTTKPKGKGTGLGLAMARGFAEQSGGALLIESNPGQGTTVLLWLPQADPAEQADLFRQDVGAADTLAAPATAMLVVDDERAVRTVLAMALAERGHPVAEAESGVAALARLDAGLATDVLVTDLAMPGGMDGLALVLEARRRRPGLPALLITGHVGDATSGALEQAAAGGPFAVLRKPVSAEMVEAQVVSLLQRVAVA